MGLKIMVFSMKMPKVPNFMAIFEFFYEKSKKHFSFLSKLFLKKPKILGTLGTQLTFSGLWCLRLRGLPNFA